MGDFVTPELVALLLGLLVTPVVSYAKNPAWSRSVKMAVTLVVSVVAAVASVYVDGSVGADNFWADLGQNLAIVVATATTFYNLHFKETQVNEKLENSGMGS